MLENKNAYIWSLDGNDNIRLQARTRSKYINLFFENIANLPIRKLKKITRWCRKCNKQ